MILSRADAVALGGARRFDGADHDRVERHVAGVFRFGGARVFVHHAREQRLVERAPVDADAHRLVVFERGFDHDVEIVVGLAADVDVAGVDAILGQRAGAFGILLEQQVAVVVEIADDGHAHAELIERIDDSRHGGGGGFGIHGHADQLRTGARQRHHLIDGRGRIRRIGIGHRLHHDRMLAADLDAADIHHNRLAAGLYCHRSSWEPLFYYLVEAIILLLGTHSLSSHACRSGLRSPGIG